MDCRADGRARWLACRAGSRNDAGKRGRLGLWPVPVSEYPAVARETRAGAKRKLGHVAIILLRGVRGGTRRPGERGAVALDFLTAHAELGLRNAGGTFFGDVRGDRA